MPESEWSAFGFTEAEAAALSRQFSEYCARFGPDNCDDAYQDAWFSVFMTIESPPTDYPTARAEQLRYLQRTGVNAASRFNSRFSYDAPLDKNGCLQSHRMTEYPTE